MIIDPQQILMALFGGILIGCSVSLFLFLTGRVTGISGILAGTVTFQVQQNLWKFLFILGMFIGGLVLLAVYPQALENSLEFSSYRIIAAGLLVGFGTRLGNGCTSGHGVCGISRFSKRSIVATISFMLAGILTVYFFGAS